MPGFPDAQVWRQAPATLSLEPGAVDLWRAGTSLAPAHLTALAKQLSREEEARAARFLVAEKKDQFIATRGQLRQVLARYLDLPPPQVPITAEPSFGKPCLDPGQTGGLEFNVSHSGRIAIIAVTRRARIGVDIEHVKRGVQAVQIAQRFFHVDEAAAIATSQTEDEVLAAFYRCWTAKEAFTKALGRGLHLPFDSFCIELSNVGDLSLAVPPPSESATAWTIRAFIAAEGYAAACAVEGRPLNWHYWTFA